MAATPESYTVRKLCEDFPTGHVERVRDSFGAAQPRRRIMTKIGPIAGLPAASIMRKPAFDLLNGERQVMCGKLKSVGRKRDGKLENVKRVNARNHNNCVIRLEFPQQHAPRQDASRPQIRPLPPN